MFPPRRVEQFILPLFILLLPVSSAWRDGHPPTTWCDFCTPASVHDAPGIGFDLTTSYGTAAAHLYNGTVLDVAKVDASPEYKSLMERLANAPPPSPPSRLALWRRWWNKQRGRPATADVGVLASLLSDLKSATSTALSPQPIDLVGITIPSIPALTPLDLADALSHAGLRSWFAEGDTRFQPKRVVQSRAAFAGNGHGLCASYTDLFECGDENDLYPSRRVLFASLTRHALYASVDVIRDAFQRWGKDGPRVMDFDAGLDARDGFPSEHDYWDHVRSRIVELVRGGGQGRQLDMVLLGGENGTDGGFLAALRYALAELGPVQGPTPPLSVEASAVANPTYAAARGMAVYARRRQEVPGHCRERWKCEEKREKERAGGNGERMEL